MKVTRQHCPMTGMCSKLVAPVINRKIWSLASEQDLLSSKPFVVYFTSFTLDKYVTFNFYGY